MTIPLALPQAPLVDVFVPGEPKPRGSPARFIVGKPGEKQRVVLTDKQGSATTQWRENIRYHLQQSTGLMFPRKTPVRAELLFVLPRPKSAPKRADGWALAAKKPDIDKLVRNCFDAITGVNWEDDSMVVDLRTTKRVAEEGERPGVHVRLWVAS